MQMHKQIWDAIDMLAERHGLSPSGLARLAGLDPTTFNRSKRQAANGKLRWPSTESIAKILGATGASMVEFAGLFAARDSAPHGPTAFIPLIGFAQAGSEGYFDDAGFPAGAGWEEIAFPEIGDEHAYALEIAGDSMTPVYRDGERIVVSPAANARRGDRVVTKTLAGEVMAKQLGRMTAKRVELQSLNPAYANRVIELADLAFLHRILWVSQ